MAPSRQSKSEWPVHRATTLTLFLVLLPYAATLTAGALISDRALVMIPVLAFSSPVMWASVQRLVRFMLTGGAPVPMARRRRRQAAGPQCQVA